MLLSYIRQTKLELSPKTRIQMPFTRKVGVLIGFIDAEGYIRIGYSALNTKSADVFSREQGIALAKQNTTCTLTPEVLATMPIKVRQAMPAFIDRCERYFKKSVIR